MIITVTLNAALDKTIFVSRLSVNGVNRVKSTRLDSGGKGINVSKAIQAMGGETVATGILGGESGLYIQHNLSTLGINSKFCFVDAPTRTNLKIVDTTLHSTTDINERGEEVLPEALDEVWGIICNMVKPGDYVIFAGTTLPGTPPQLLADWTRQLRELGAYVVVDSTGPDMKNAIQQKPFLIKPNKEELEELCGRRLYFDVDVIFAAKELISEGAEHVIVSLGADGAIFVTEDSVYRAYTAKVSSQGTTGAGDSLTGAMVYSLSKGNSWRNAINYSMAAASAFVTHPGGAVATREEIEGLLNEIRVDEFY